MCDADKVWITELTLIHKNIRSVRNCSSDVTRMPVLKISTYIITARPVELSAILAIVYVSTYKTTVILYIMSATCMVKVKYLHFKIQLESTP